MKRILLASLAVLCFLSTPRLPGQPHAGTGQISGHVGDEVGAVIGKASVFVRRYSPTENGVELVTHSDGQGNFVVTLAPGAYDVLVTSAGFMSKMQTVVVQAGKTQKLEWKLTAQPCDFPTANCDTFR